MAPHHREHGVAHSVHHITYSYIQLHITQSFLLQIYIALEAVLLKLHMKLTPGWVLIQVKFDPIQENGPKVGGGHSFVNGHSFMRLRYCHKS